MELKKYDEETESAKALYSSPEYIRRVKVVTALWDRMTSFFGARWTTAYGEAGDRGFKTWLDMLGEFTEDQIARGVKSAQEWTDPFPPTLPQFRKLCRTVRPEEKPNFTERRIAGEGKLAKGMAGAVQHLAKHATSPTARRELDRMKRMAAGEEIETKEESYNNLGLNRRWGAL